MVWLAWKRVREHRAETSAGTDLLERKALFNTQTVTSCSFHQASWGTGKFDLPVVQLDLSVWSLDVSFG